MSSLLDNRNVVVGRKDHICDYCARTIKQGTKSISEPVTPWSTDSDSFRTFRAHLECDAAWKKYDREAWVHGEAPEAWGVDFVVEIIGGVR